MSAPDTRRRRRRPGARASHVTVRMYNVGFGDAFLLFIPTQAGIRKVLIDCGSIKQGAHPIETVVARIIEDVTEDDGVPRIDVVVATHRHRDHVSGFDNPVWARVEVREVWMPWTEDPKDPEAREIREAQARLAVTLHSALTRLGAAPEFQMMAVNALTNEDAMATLHEGFKGRQLRRFLPAKKREESTFESDALPGVIVHVLGPSRDEEVIRDMNPPVGRSYLRLFERADAGPPVPPRPFSDDWALDAEAFGSLHPHIRLTAKDYEALHKAGEGLEETVAVSLDSAVNGTSLMLMFRVGRAHLLFPGDAQWGTWRVAMEDPEWRALLKKTMFYKIGHHGSHNATPVDFVERLLGDDFWAMASVTAFSRWPSIPRKPLLAALRQKSKKVIRSDKLKEARKPAFFANADISVDARVPVV